MSYRRPKSDLASRLQARRRQPLLNLALFAIGGVLLAGGILALLAVGLPWHWQLFGRWLLITQVASYKLQRFAPYTLFDREESLRNSCQPN